MVRGSPHNRAVPVKAVARVKILYVEDDPDLCEAIVQILAMWGHEAAYFIRARELLKHLGTAGADDFDLLITDYYVPDINGVDLIKLLRVSRPGMPAILLTGSREPSVLKAASRIERCEVLYKPLDMDELAARVEAHDVRRPALHSRVAGQRTA
jgi:DNA-binding response OmpR family regulator